MGSLEMSDWIGVSQIVLALVALAIAARLYWRTVGYSLSARYSIESNKFSEVRINNINITNHKDRAVAIYGIHAEVSDRYLIMNVVEIDNPIVIPAFESRLIISEPFTKYLNNDTDMRDEFYRDTSNNIKLIATTEGKIVAIQSSSVPRIRGSTRYSHLIRVGKETRKHNGKVVSLSDEYVIILVDDTNQQHTAFAGRGLIRELPYGMLKYDQDEIRDEYALKKLLEQENIRVISVEKLR